jgi:tetratricopeptide (TPR) repeat protein
MIGKALLSLGKLEDGIEKLSEAVDRDPKDPWTHLDLGKALEEKEEWDGAEESYRRAIEADPELSDPYFYLAVLLDEVQVEKKEALEHYKKYLELGGEDPDGDVKKRIEKLERK